MISEIISLKLKRNSFISIFLIIELCLLLLLNKNYNSNILLKQIIKKKEFQRINSFFELCKFGILLNKMKFKISFHPKISIIIPIYNKEKYILRFLRSIQNQFFDDIEIILIDDHSIDSTLEIIEKLRKKDERIKLIKNKKNYGTLKSRNEGAFKANGKYLIFLDPDDLLSYNILILCYNLAEKYNYDIIRFNIYEGNEKINLDSLVNKIINKTVFKPEISLYLFYGLGKLEELDYYITNKLIKKELFIKSLNLINEYYLNNFMIDCEDGLINFILYRLANSYYFIIKIGYIYAINEESITIANFMKWLKSNFLYLKFIFQNTKNNIVEKNIANYIFLGIYSRHRDDIIQFFKSINDIGFYKEIIDLYINCKYISPKTKEILSHLNFLINQNKKLESEMF